MQYDFLCDNILIVCPISYKEGILNYLTHTKKIMNIKFMTIEEYKKNYLFDYNIDTIHYLTLKGMKVENAYDLINNLYYIENQKYDSDKLNYLVKIKKELDENKLLIYNPLFKKVLARWNKVVYGYGKLDSFYSKIMPDFQVIPYQKEEKKYLVYYFSNIEEEVEFVFQKVVDLLHEGVDINKISIMNIDDQYIPIIKRMAGFYGIEVNETNTDTLMGTIIGQEFFHLVQEGYAKEDIVDKLRRFENEDGFSIIINLINRYSNYKLIDVLSEIKYELLNYKVGNIILEKALKIKNLFDFVDDDEYVFLLNFNNGVIPSFKMDTDYITNNIKEEVGLLKIEEENALIKENTLNYLGSISNLIISYKEKSPFNKYYPSILLDDMNYEELNYERSMNYSEKANRSFYTKYLDDYVKYGIKNKNLDILFYNYKKNDYATYNNEFSGINKDNLINFLNNELTLSYTSIDNYYKCGFKYYLANILKIDLFEENFMTIIGNLFHYALSKMDEDNFDLEKVYNDFIKEKKWNNKEKFFIEKLKNDLSFVIETIRKHQFITGFTKMLYEKKFDIVLKEAPYVHFKGYVDKIMYQEKNNETLVSIIDYKTGNPDIKIKNLKFGLSMQLPIYLYLVKNSELFHNMKFTGFYLQHILNVDIKKNNKKSILEQKKDNLKLAGYSTNNQERLSIFDSTYENSEMIRGMKIKKDGTLSIYANTLSDEEINDILKKTHKKIIEAMDEILKGQFFINPKIIDGKNESCEYCSFKDICFHEGKNNIYLKSEEGDKDAKLDEGTE